MRGICRLAENFLANQEGFYFMQLVCSTRKYINIATLLTIEQCGIEKILW
jgi:hypothetical protein